MLAYHPNARALAQSLLPLPEHDVIYVRVPKAACSTLKLWLHRIHTNDYDFDPGNVHGSIEVPKPHQIGWRTVSKMLSGDAYRFTFVRNPSDRVVSAYFSKIVRPRKQSYRDEVRTALGLGPDVELTFDHFVAAMEATEPTTWNAHWRPQHLITMHGLVEYETIGRVETFDADLARIRDEAGLPEAPLKTRNYHGGYDDPRAGRPEFQRRLEKLCAEDYEVFGY